MRALGTATREQIHALHQIRQEWFPSRPADERAVDLLDRIAASGEVAAVPQLVPLLLGGRGMSAAVAGAMARLLDGQPVTTIGRLEALRTFGGCEYYRFGDWSVLRAKDVAGVAQLPSAWAALGVLSFHPSGWVREAAVRELAKLRDPVGHEVPFLLRRMNDWVVEVRRPALEAMQARVRLEYAGALVHALPFILELRSSGRRADHERFVESALALLTGAARGALRRGVRHQHRDVARASLRALLAKEHVDESLVADGLESPDMVIRLQSARRLRRLARTPSLLEMLRRAAVDRAYPVRREAVGLLLDFFPEHAEPVLEEALLDSHPELRSTARRQLARSRPDFVAADRYRAALPMPSGRRLRAAVLGLAECKREEDVLDLLPLLASPAAKTRRAAIVAVAGLDAQSVEPFLEALEDPAPRVSRIAAEVLSRRLSPRVLASVVEIGARTTAPASARHAALMVLHATSPWTRVACLLQAASSQNVQWAQLAAGAINPYTASPPLSDELAAIRSWLPRAKISRELAVAIEGELASWAARGS